MAISKEMNFRGIELENAYIKIKSVKLDLEVYKDQQARIDGQILEHKAIYVPVDSMAYGMYKDSLEQEVEDVLVDDWKNPVEEVDGGE